MFMGQTEGVFYEGKQKVVEDVGLSMYLTLLLRFQIQSKKTLRLSKEKKT